MITGGKVFSGITEDSLLKKYPRFKQIIKYQSKGNPIDKISLKYSKEVKKKKTPYYAHSELSKLSPMEKHKVVSQLTPKQKERQRLFCFRLG